MGKTPTVSTVYPPAYVRLKEHEREAFLSQLGTFSPVERELFHSLCMGWRPEIHYGQFVELQSSRMKHVRPELESLVGKLYAHGYALFVFTLEENSLVQKYIVLTEQHDHRFCYYVVRNTIYEAAAERKSILPAASYFQEKGLVLPEEEIIPLEPDALLKEYLEEKIPPLHAVSISLDGKALIYLVPDGFTVLLNHCRSMVQLTMENTNVLAEFARFKGTSLAAVRSSLSSRSPLLWFDVVRSLVEYDEVMGENKRVYISPVVFLAARMLRIALENQIEETKRKKQEEEEKKNDFTAICEQVKEQYPEPISGETLSRLFSVLERKYGERFEEVKREFLEEYSTIKDPADLPPLIFIAKKYLHRDRFYGYALARFDFVARRLAEDYVDLMEEVLRTGNRAGHTAFLSPQQFEDDIRERVSHLDPFLAELLSRPRLLAEVIIYTLKDQEGARDVQRLKRVLERFFYPNTMRYLPLSRIFDLDMEILFERAFGRMGIFRQLWWYITGRYRTYKERFEGFTPRIVSLAAPAQEKSQLTIRSARSATVPPPLPARKGKSAVPTSRVIRQRPMGSQIKEKRAYSPREQERVWNEFAKALRESARQNK
ncbi:hypothetical protein Spith_2131 [Spirochaeta thermophila DSM 6578]|uniref:Uncharacterized protein n=1 Tax=Winmispira thermophila (strain ATCC 700085 / DSM 6578 / Z-1203) TaxID=869211 RepID=G0GFI7_WINT7|nr:hypothetical protein [Spirochaeta thermophila]AEJ62386.1 hypothetical protein Spith_2131 [Spirochaeta thermophila DSM 6578]